MAPNPANLKKHILANVTIRINYFKKNIVEKDIVEKKDIFTSLIS